MYNGSVAHNGYLDKYLEGCISKTTWPFDFKLETGYVHTIYLY